MKEVRAVLFTYEEGVIVVQSLSCRKACASFSARDWTGFKGWDYYCPLFRVAYPEGDVRCAVSMEEAVALELMSDD